jgi:hypothetical protein
MLAFAREGDFVVVHSMDRLARNLDDLRKLVQLLKSWSRLFGQRPADLRWILPGCTGAGLGDFASTTGGVADHS